MHMHGAFHKGEIIILKSIIEMKNQKSNCVERKKWEKPKINSLSFRQTLGGNNPTYYEGFPDDGSITVGG